MIARARSGGLAVAVVALAFAACRRAPSDKDLASAFTRDRQSLEELVRIARTKNIVEIDVAEHGRVSPSDVDRQTVARCRELLHKVGGLGLYRLQDGALKIVVATEGSPVPILQVGFLNSEQDEPSQTDGGARKGIYTAKLGDHWYSLRQYR